MCIDSARSFVTFDTHDFVEMLNSNSLHLSYLVTCFIFTENLALHKPTWEQYPWPDIRRDFGSENAVDGFYTDRGTGGQCTISDDGKYTATWRVDLGGVVSISCIDIYYRTDNQGMCNFLKFNF